MIGAEQRMSTKSYMLSKKYTLFPEFLKMDKNEEFDYAIKCEYSNPNKLTYKEWFWFHPSSYLLINYGVSLLCFIMFGIGAFLSFVNDLFIPTIICILLSLSGLFDFYKKIKTGTIKGITFYKLWLQ